MEEKGFVHGLPASFRPQQQNVRVSANKSCQIVGSPCNYCIHKNIRVSDISGIQIGCAKRNWGSSSIERLLLACLGGQKIHANPKIQCENGNSQRL